MKSVQIRTFFSSVFSWIRTEYGDLLYSRNSYSKASLESLFCRKVAETINVKITKNINFLFWITQVISYLANLPPYLFLSYQRTLQLSIRITGSNTDSCSLDSVIPITAAFVDLAMSRTLSIFGKKLLILRWSKSRYPVMKICSLFRHYPTNTPRGFHVETTWKRPFPRRFNVESTWCVYSVQSIMMSRSRELDLCYMKVISVNEKVNSNS